MGFIHTLTKVTGIEEVDGLARLINNEIRRNPKFINSGVGLKRVLDPTKLDFEASEEGIADYFKQGKRFNPTRLNMPPNCLEQGPHCHPGGEFSYIIQGSYFDADMEGKSIREYTEGDTIFYAKGSTHRPLSRDGANILYIPFDGILFGKSPEDLAKKMVKIATPEEALEYALTWMVPEQKERQRILDFVWKKEN